MYRIANLYSKYAVAVSIAIDFCVTAVYGIQVHARYVRGTPLNQEPSQLLFFHYN